MQFATLQLWLFSLNWSIVGCCALCVYVCENNWAFCMKWKLALRNWAEKPEERTRREKKKDQRPKTRQQNQQIIKLYWISHIIFCTRFSLSFFSFHFSLYLQYLHCEPKSCTQNFNSFFEFNFLDYSHTIHCVHRSTSMAQHNFAPSFHSFVRLLSYHYLILFFFFHHFLIILFNAGAFLSKVSFHFWTFSSV